MMNSYFFIYNSFAGTQEKIRDFLNDMPSIIHWRYDMPGMFYVVSEKNANDLLREFEERSRLANVPNAKYVFSEYNGNAQGRLTKGSWHLLNKKEVLKEEAED